MNRRDFLIAATSAVAGAAVCPSRSFAAQDGIDLSAIRNRDSWRVAAFDERVKAMVTSCGFTSMRKYDNGNLAGWAGTRYMPRIAGQYGNDPARMPFDFPHILVALAPRPLFINAPLHDSNFDVSGVRDCVDAAMPVYDRVFRAKDRLVAIYPDAGHEFPSRIRAAAYDFLDKWLE